MTVLSVVSQKLKLAVAWLRAVPSFESSVTATPDLDLVVTAAADYDLRLRKLRAEAYNLEQMVEAILNEHFEHRLEREHGVHPGPSDPAYNVNMNLKVRTDHVALREAVMKVCVQLFLKDAIGWSSVHWVFGTPPNGPGEQDILSVRWYKI
jgi:hypothetical protein